LNIHTPSGRNLVAVALKLIDNSRRICKDMEFH